MALPQTGRCSLLNQVIAFLQQLLPKRDCVAFTSIPTIRSQPPRVGGP